MKRAGVKDRIIEAASHLFYFQGYNQTGINQIIEEANVAKASMYQHFRSKEDIAVTYLKERHISWTGNLFEFIADCKGYREKLIASFDYLETWLAEVEYRGCGFQNIVCDLSVDQEKIRDQVVLHKNELRKWVHGLLKEETTMNSKEAEELGDEIIVLMEGAIILSQIQKNNWPIQSAKKSCIKLLP